MKFNLDNISLSYGDIKNGIILPKKPSKELAELIGILTGDGNVDSSRSGEDHITAIAGHIIDDLKDI